MGSFESAQVFTIGAPAIRIHEAVLQPDRWLADCGLLREVALVREGGVHGVGARHRAVLRAAGYLLSWELETIRSVPGRLVEWAASGDIAGRGLWELEERAGTTRVTTTWTARPTRAWMSLASPLTRGLVASEHAALMRDGIRALAVQLDAEVVDDLSLCRSPGRGERGLTTLAGATGAVLGHRRSPVRDAPERGVPVRGGPA